MTVQPAASAGAAFCVPSVSGPLKGGIATTTPTGSRRTSEHAAGLRRSSSNGYVRAEVRVGPQLIEGITAM
jgi:hypothetical protein